MGKSTQISKSRWRAVVSTIVVIVVLTTMVVAYVRSDYHRHNRFLARLRLSLSSLPLPTETTRLESVSRVGLLAGNGNHCDYVVAEMHSTKLGRDSILRHYRQQRIPNPEGSNYFSVVVTFVEGDRPPDFDLYDPLFSDVETSPGESRYVISIILISYHDAGSDLRCH